MRLFACASLLAVVLFCVRLCYPVLCVFWAMRLSALLYYMRLWGFASFAMRLLQTPGEYCLRSREQHGTK